MVQFFDICFDRIFQEFSEKMKLYSDRLFLIGTLPWLLVLIALQRVFQDYICLSRKRSPTPSLVGVQMNEIPKVKVLERKKVKFVYPHILICMLLFVDNAVRFLWFVFI